MEHKGEIKQKFINLAYQKIKLCLEYCRQRVLTLQHSSNVLIKCVGIVLVKPLNIISVTDCLEQCLLLFLNTLTWVFCVVDHQNKLRT